LFVPGLSRINNISPDKRSWDYEFNCLGLVISGHSECTASETAHHNVVSDRKPPETSEKENVDQHFKAKANNA